MGIGYQETDRAVIDYELYDLADVHSNLRGPDPSRWNGNEFIVCAGAAQTFGRFAPRPFPTQLAETLRAPVYNLGFAGGGPFYFLKNQRLLEFMNRAGTCVLQVMSGRSVSNSVFEVTGMGGTVVSRGRRGVERPRLAQDAYRSLLQECDESRVREIVAETRQNWVNEMIELLDKISCPTVLLWFSTRSPEYETSYRDVGRLFGQFPQLVNSEMMAQVARHADRYVQAITDRGLPHLLRNKTTGQPETVFSKERFPNRPDDLRDKNNYYPSQEMHDDAAKALASVLRE